MHGIGHDFHFPNPGTSSIADFANDLLQRLIDWRQENLPAIFRAPDYMIFTGVDHVAVGLVRHLDNGERAGMFALSSLSWQNSRRGARMGTPAHPMPKGRGLRGDLGQ